MMVDTIIIEIDTGERLSQVNFSSIARETNQRLCDDWGNNLFLKFIEPKWPVDMSGEYLPKVEYAEYPNPYGGGGRGYCYTYRIAIMSVPKFLYGNNILEVGEDQFESFVNLLYTKLYHLHLPTKITKDMIRRATVRRVDYGKNVLLPGEASLTTLMHILERAEHRKGSKNLQIQYKQGDLYREGIKERQFVVYDKMSEFRNTTSPSDEFERLFVSLHKANLLQVARVELQIQTTKQLRLELKSLNLDEEGVSLANIFSLNLAQQLLSKYWNNLTKTIGTEVAPLGPDHLLEVFESFIMVCSPQKAFVKLGFSVLVAECGLNAVKEMFQKYAKDAKAWSTTKKTLHIPLCDKAEYPYIKMIGNAIASMNLIRLSKGGKND